MSKILILIFHPDLAASRANRALVQAAATVPGVEIVDVTARCPESRIDTDVEVADLLSADRLVLQFPIRWYSTPPLMKAWQDLVLTRMMYLAPQTEGARLAGVPVMVAATAGNYRTAYGPDGVNLFPLADLLKPLQASANRCGLVWSEPHLVYEADKLGPEQLTQEGERYADRLRAWTRQTAGRRLAANA